MATLDQSFTLNSGGSAILPPANSNPMASQPMDQSFSLSGSGGSDLAGAELSSGANDLGAKLEAGGQTSNSAYGGTVVAGLAKLGQMSSSNKDYSWDDYAIEGATMAVDQYYFGGIPVTNTLANMAGLGASGGDDEMSEKEKAETDYLESKTDINKETVKNMQLRRKFVTWPYDVTTGILKKVKG